jgi:hypothetical protein
LLSHDLTRHDRRNHSARESFIPIAAVCTQIVICRNPGNPFAEGRAILREWLLQLGK